MRNKMFMALGLSIGLLIFTTNAQTWSSLIRLTWNSDLSMWPCITADSSNGIHLAWKQYTPGNPEIFYKKSTNLGGTWLPSVRLTWGAALSSGPNIAADSSDQIHIVWSAYVPGSSEIFYKRSLNGRADWSVLRRLTWNSGSSLAPAVGIDNSDGIHVVWYDDTPGNFEIFYKKSTDGGTNWSSAKRLTWNPISSIWPKVALDTGSGVHVVWEDGNQGDWNAHEILYKRSTDGGTTWLAVKRLTWNSGGSYDPSIDTDNLNGIHIAWHDTTPGFSELFYKMSTDAGLTWLAPKRLTYNSGPSSYASIVAESWSKIHLVWHYPLGDYEIFFKTSTNGGGSWAGLKRLTWNSGNSYYTSMAVDPTNGIHVVWFDETPGYSEIFYKNRKQITRKFQK